MSDQPKNYINELLESEDIDEIIEGIKTLGDSVERLYLADRVKSLRGNQ